MKIILATGGSGGHIFPALKVAQELKQLGHDILLVGAFGPSLPKVEQSGFAFRTLSSKGLKCSSLKGFLESCFLMTRALSESSRILKSFEPQRVCGFGGYGAFPVVLMAKVLKYPAMIHEQNVVPGRANRLLAKWSDKIAITFPESSNHFDPAKTVLTGCPCHAQPTPQTPQALRAQQELDPERITILILGGSQGSHCINIEFMKTIPLLKARLKFQVIHISGTKDYEDLRIQYASQGIPFRLFDFFEDMGAAYQMADVVIARAGAVTVLEIARFARPSILIPYPLAGGHQKENAKILCQKGFARLVEENDLSPECLERQIRELLNGHSQEQGKNLEEIVIPDSSNRLAREIISLGTRTVKK